MLVLSGMLRLLLPTMILLIRSRGLIRMRNVVLDDFKLHAELIVAFLKNCVRLFQIAMLDVDLLKHVASVVIIVELGGLLDGSVENLG